jgi:hypothetical protein
MSMVHLHAHVGDCEVHIRERTKNVHEGRAMKVGVDGLELICDPHGLLGTYSMAQYPKYRLALAQAEADGAAHLGLDRAPWSVLD